MGVDTGKATVSFFLDEKNHVDQSIVVIDIYTNDKLSDKDLDAIHNGIISIGNS